MICSLQNCENERFEDLDKCALHCSSININDKNKSSHMSKFYEEFHKYIFERLHALNEIKYESVKNNGMFTLNVSKQVIANAECSDPNDIERNSNFIKIVKDYEISIHGINFPVNMDSTINGEINILYKLKSIRFVNCNFLNMWENNKNSIFYEDCCFLNELVIHADIDLDESEDFSSKIDISDKNYRFKNCNFKKNVVIKDFEDNNLVTYNVFNSCVFENDISIKNVKVAKRIIKVPENKKENGIIYNYIKASSKKRIEINKIFNFTNINIEKCEFFSKFKINGVGSYDIEKYIKENNMDEKNLDLEFPQVHIDFFKIEDTKFKSKFELKNSRLEKFKFHDSNVEGIFDINESCIVKADFYKSIFEEFAAFGNVIFGNKEKENITDFMYTTFKDFSSFRDSNFKSGLRFSKANIKQEPNFLNAQIDINLTDRETLRVIKNSFEKNNNKIESNRFFIYEMFSYRREIRDDIKYIFSNISDKKIFVLYQFFLCLSLFLFYPIVSLKQPINKKIHSEIKTLIGLLLRNLVVSANYHISRFGASYMKPILLFIFSVALYTWILNIHNCIFDEKNRSQYILFIKKFVTQDWFVALSKFLNSCAANVPLFSKALEKKSGIEFISLLFFIWFGILTWQIIVAVKRNTQH